MQHIDIRKKRPSRWPWLAGAVVLALVAWGVTALLRTEPEEEPALAVPTVEDTLPPAAIPAPPYESYDGDTSSALDALAPLDERDAGEAVRIQGQVVATGNDAFWLASGGIVLRVDSDRNARKGDSLVVAGTLTTADPEKTDRIRDFLDRHPRSGSWTIHRDLKLVEERADTGGEEPRGATEG